VTSATACRVFRCVGTREGRTWPALLAITSDPPRRNVTIWPFQLLRGHSSREAMAMAMAMGYGLEAMAVCCGYWRLLLTGGYRYGRSL